MSDHNCFGTIAIILATAISLLSSSSAADDKQTDRGAEKARPFPENRVRDFYANQARHYLASGRPLPEIIPEFLGLDGGSFGHWARIRKRKTMTGPSMTSTSAVSSLKSSITTASGPPKRS